MYALYQHYGYDRGDIGRLFIAGFGSSMIFGTFIGSMGDKYGRRFAGFIYVAAYVGSCVTKHWSDYGVLMLGRVLGGIATSLLFSCFESWVVAEHFKRGYDGDWLGDLFSKAVFLGNGVVAIASGLLANSLVSTLALGPVAPFDAAAAALLAGGAIIRLTWTEKYGDASDGRSMGDQFKAAWGAIRGDRSIALLGAIQALFEASMYTFVFLWTPALAPRDEAIPHGFIFAIFMLASMIGSSYTAKLMAGPVPPQKYMQYVFLAGAFSLFTPAFMSVAGFHDSGAKGGPMTHAGRIQMLGFCIFEACVGIFWPSMMKMRAQYVPEELRSTIINVFRIPLNLFVCIVLYNVSLFPLPVYFVLTGTFMLGAWALQVKLHALVAGARKGGAPK